MLQALTRETDKQPPVDGSWPRRSRRLWLAAALAILAIAAVLRFTGLNWDQAQWIHPDEGHMRLITGAIAWPRDLSLYFDTGISSLNPRNHDQVYSYGTLPLFATRAVAEWLDSGCTSDASPLSRFIAGSLLARTGQPEASSSGTICRPGTFTWTYSAFVGRHLSALADLGTIVLIGLLGRTLYGRRAALLAMALGATTAFMIQQAHFYTVDSAATFFTALTALYAVRAGRARTRGRLWLGLSAAGISTGLAAACKVSAALAAGLVALAALGWLRGRITAIAPLTLRPRWRRADQGTGPHLLSLTLNVIGATLLAALLSLMAFRIGQPYAFRGPGFFGIRPNPVWFERLTQIQEEQSGTIDYPSGRQWTDRLPVVFPLRNLALWGAGLPLGLAMAAGWAQSGWELIHGGRRHLVIWLWSTAYVAFYATRWVKAMRYFLPVYPLLILMAAYALERLVHPALRSGRGPSLSGGEDNLAGSVLLRIAPGRWLRPAIVALVVVGSALWGIAMFGVYTRPHTRVAASRWIYANVPDGSVVANEHWDWGLPLRIDGHNPFGAGADPTYTQLTMELYNEDTPEKREQLLSWLDQADYLFLASNRLYASIGRMPQRYPLTTEYYRALFAGDLGFALAAEVTSYLQLGPVVFPDQENPFPLMPPAAATQDGLLAIGMPPAEESFSVYDHPNCLIFRKTPAYAHEKAAELLGQVDLSQVARWQTPQEATPPVVRVAHGVLFYLLLAFTAIAGLLGLIPRGS